MKQNSPCDQAIGFVSVLRHESEWLGGLLLLNGVGKPLEFHCTAPVRPTAAHQVLYGPTLDSYVLADNIAPKLIAALKQQPAIICTDCIEMTAATIENCGIAFVDCRVDKSDSEAAGEFEDSPATCFRELDESQLRLLNSLDQVTIGDQRLRIEAGKDSRKSEVISQLKKFASQIELTEPFERIHHAIQQSHGIKSQEAA